MLIPATAHDMKILAKSFLRRLKSKRANLLWQWGQQQKAGLSKEQASLTSCQFPLRA